MVNLEKLQPVAKRLIDQYFREGLSSLTPRDRVFFLVWCHGVELDNNGHAAFFYNSEANNYIETVDALKELGLDLFADLLQRAAMILFNGAVPRDWDERNAIIQGLPDLSALDSELYSLDNEFGSHGGGDRDLEVLERWYFDHQNG